MNMKWKTLKLGAICSSVCSGGTPKSTNKAYYTGGNIPWLNTKEVNFNRIHDTEKYITELGLKNSSAKWIDKNCVIVAMYGATAGRVAISKIKLTTNQACCNLSIDENQADYNFVYYVLCLNYENLLSMANGGAQQNLNAQQIKDFEIPLPPLSTQKKIARVLGALDDKIELNNQINHNLEEQAKVLFKSWFVDFEPFGGKMPDDWREGTISDLGEVVGGSTPSKARPEYYTEHGIAWITPKDLSLNKNKFISHGMDDITELGLNNSSAKLMPRGSVLFSSRAPIGYTAIASGTVCTNQGFKSVVPKPNIGTAFIYYLLKENLERIENMASGSTFKEISGTTMKSIPVIVPTNDILQHFQDTCTPIFEQQELLESENNRLAQLRDSLLPKLMSGDIDVSEVEV